MGVLQVFIPCHLQEVIFLAAVEMLNVDQRKMYVFNLSVHG